MNLDDYIATDNWIRNYKAMKDSKLLNCLDDFRFAASHPGYITSAVGRVMEHGGDIDTNHEACKEEARRRGLTVL